MVRTETSAWWKEGVVYQVWPRSFRDSNGDGVGDLRGVIDSLPYIKSLGVDILWFNPIFKSPNDDMGYDVSDYQAILPEFGTMEDFDELLAKAHGMGLKVVLDLVANHSSDEHPWFLESRQSRDNPKSDWYIWRDKPNNWGAWFGGSAWEYVPERDQYYLHCFSKKQPDLNWENPDVRKAIYGVMRFWGDKGVDGFRFDAVSHYSKDLSFPDTPPDSTGYGFPAALNGPHEHLYLKEMHREVISHYDWMTVGEGGGSTPESTWDYVDPRRKELDMVFVGPHTAVGRPRYGNGYDLSGFDLPAFKAIIDLWQRGMEHHGWMGWYLENHDQVRSVSRWGNDGIYWKESGKMLATLLLVLRGTPYFYMGEELGMTNYPFSLASEVRDLETVNDLKVLAGRGYAPDRIWNIIRQTSRDNSRTPMQWTDGEHAGFSTALPWIGVNPRYKEINAEGEEQDPDSILWYYRHVIQVRKAHHCAIYGSFHLLAPKDEQVFAFTRDDGDEELLVVLNFTGVHARFPIPERFRNAKRIADNYADAPSSLLHAYEAYVLARKR